MKTVLTKITTLLCAVLMVMTAIVPISVTAAEAEEDYYWPVPSSRYVSQKYKSGHIGIDIGNGKAGTEIAATKSGTVCIIYTGCNNWNGKTTKVKCKDAGKCTPNHSYTGRSTATTYKYCNNGYGNGVIIRHDDGSYSMYAHMDKVYVTDAKGKNRVNQGDIIGTMGSSGYSEARHLHFELCGAVDIQGSYYANTDPQDSNVGKTNYIYSLGTPVTLNYKDNYGTTERIYIDNSTYGTLITPKNPGYVFQGWYTKENGQGTKINSTTALISKDAHNLYAYWKICLHIKNLLPAYSGGICSICQHEYNYKITTLKSATPYKVTKDSSAPVWSRPYSNNSTQLNQIKNGSVV
ncbi:MAG: peptidoglycan DD-metalloendopeptidase family protein, partial [Clostridia bacterium]|nr:peptidoglycan DD-metalloendopeptidase family protein [Clostridia bacterium]